MTLFLILAINFLAVFFLLVLIYLLLRPVINGAIYFPSSRTHIESMLRLAHVRAGEQATDLGSGDGRVLLALARSGARPVGYEINPLLVLQSRARMRSQGFGKTVRIFWRSFWRESLSPYDVVVVYGIPYIMGRLEKKLRRELKPGARVISNIFRFPGWRPERSEDGVHLYVQR